MTFGVALYLKKTLSRVTVKGFLSIDQETVDMRKITQLSSRSERFAVNVWG